MVQPSSNVALKNERMKLHNSGNYTEPRLNVLYTWYYMFRPH